MHCLYVYTVRVRVCTSFYFTFHSIFSTVVANPCQVTLHIQSSRSFQSVSGHIDGANTETEGTCTCTVQYTCTWVIHVQYVLRVCEGCTVHVHCASIIHCVNNFGVFPILATTGHSQIMVSRVLPCVPRSSCKYGRQEMV